MGCNTHAQEREREHLPAVMWMGDFLGAGIGATALYSAREQHSSCHLCECAHGQWYTCTCRDFERTMIAGWHLDWWKRDEVGFGRLNEVLQRTVRPLIWVE